MKGTYDVRSAGDSALVVRFEEAMSPVVNAKAVAFADAIGSAAITGVRDIVPAYHAVTIYFDPLRTDRQALDAAIARAIPAANRVRATPHAAIDIPVCYGGEFGPDLAAVAQFAAGSEEEVIALHASVTYRVYMLGFVPGFGYMGVVPDRIAAPRLPTPRLRVPAGSIGIAGNQTGVYPAATPGGWQLIGRTPLRPFDPARADPFLFRAGDRIRFHPISADTYRRLGRPATA